MGVCLFVVFFVVEQKEFREGKGMCEGKELNGESG